MRLLNLLRGNRTPYTAIFVLLLASAGMAAAAPPVELVIEEDLLIWKLNVETKGLTLSVSGPNSCFIERGFKANKTPTLSIFDSQGKPLEDGRYSWQIIATETISSGQQRELERIRDSADFEAVKILAEQLPQGFVESGSFGVLEGQFVLPKIEKSAGEEARGEQPAPSEKVAARGSSGGWMTSGEVLGTPKDFVILDDLIVDGSACIGFDCVNGESFSFDTIRLKENNLRIKFQDTSVAASFPSTDWELMANDSANGGQSRFAIRDDSASRIPFSIEANAPSNALYVDDGGRLGLGTSTPTADVHVISGDSPTVRLEQNGSSGFAPQTWDVAGNETNFFVRDVSNGSQLPFRIRPSAPTSSIDISSSGDVGLGTTSPSEPLHVLENAGGFADVLRLENNGGIGFVLEDSASATEWNFQIRVAGDEFRITKSGTGDTEMTLDTNGDMTINGTLTENSNRDAKHYVADVDPIDILKGVAELPIGTWTYKDDSAQAVHIGPMAQDFFASFGYGGTDRGIAPRNLAGVALVALQGLHQVVDEKDQAIEALERQNQELLERLEALEARILGSAP